MTEPLFEAFEKLKEGGGINRGDSVRTAPPGKFGLWFSTAHGLQSCAMNSWAYNIALSWASFSPFAQDGSGSSVSESVPTWNCSVLWAQQLSEGRQERTAYMSLRFIHICISLFPAPSFGRHINKHLAPTCTREHRSPSFTASSVGAGQSEEQGLHGICPIWDWLFSCWSGKNCVGVSAKTHEPTLARASPLF